MGIIIGADIVPTETNKEMFIRGDAEGLIGADLQKILTDADYRIFNLEVPLTDQQTPIAKCGPNLIASTATINGYNAIGVNLLTLANNHILDQDQQGLESTCKVLQENGIRYLGVGATPEAAAKPYIIDFVGKKVGVYACAEHEFSIVTSKSAGANPFDPLESPDHVAELKKQCDYVIVLYHGGKEHYRYPSPNLQKTCRKLVEKGADLVVCQHSHCIGCEEKYMHGTIVYGQGNFLFDRSDSEFWQTSLLIQINHDFSISYIPLKKCGNTVRLAVAENADSISNGFWGRSEEIKNDEFVAQQYGEFADSMLNGYLFAMSGIRRSFFYKVFDKLSGHRLTSWIVKHRYKDKQKLALQNYIECEAHRELFGKGLETR